MSSSIDHAPPFAGFARGWFVISFSDEVATGQVVPLRYFGKDLVLFRTEAGEARVFDAFCPHLGAHLGHGGKVSGEGLVCPFHAWRFDARGDCVEIPYAKRVPPKAKIDCWPVVERNGIVFVWHDPEKGAPEYEIPAIDDYVAGRLLPWKHSHLEVKTPPLAIVENVADIGHFIPVHQTHPDVAAFQNEYVGHTATQINKGVAYPLRGGRDPYELRATYYGPGYQVTHLSGVGKGWIVNAHTPIDEERVVLRFAVSLAPSADPRMTHEFMDRYVDNMRDGFLQDVRIWENKIYLDRPTLCDGDGPIGQLRRWYRQFYEPRTISAAAAE
jgi:3-ketosteroid 9alpha-monooxygenase subunit A